MLTMYAPTEDYLETQVRTASPDRLHLMVVEAAVRYARQGLEALEARNWERSFQTLSKARDCVVELLAGIRPDPNPDLAGQLRSLFTFVHRQLATADLKHDSAAARNAIAILELHRATWLELMKRLQSERQTAPAAAPQTSWVT